jgi:hypothetical protein
MSKMMEQQNKLLRLIVQVKAQKFSQPQYFLIDFFFSSRCLLLMHIKQKMEIKSEADDVDEGVSIKEVRPLSGIINDNPSRWTSPRIRKKLRALKGFNKSFQ